MSCIVDVYLCMLLVFQVLENRREKDRGAELYVVLLHLPSSRNPAPR